VLPSTITRRAARSRPSSGPASWRSLDSLLIAAAVVGQGAALADAGAGNLALSVAAAVICAVAWEWRARLPHLDFVIAATAFGGLGMAAATAIGGDAGHAAHGMAHGSTASHGYGGAIVGMLIVCVPACAWRCDPLSGGGFARQALALLIATAGMLAGMAIGGWTAGPWLASLLGAAAGMHVAMVLGMAAGTALSLPAVALLNRRHRHPRSGPRDAVCSE
jgi:hypothetical protein